MEGAKEQGNTLLLSLAQPAWVEASSRKPSLIAPELVRSITGPGPPAPLRVQVKPWRMKDAGRSGYSALLALGPRDHQP